MDTRSVAIRTESIRLDSFLKWADVVMSGGEAKHLIKDGYVKVNGEREIRRGRSLVSGDRVEVEVPEKPLIRLQVLHEG